MNTDKHCIGNCTITGKEEDLKFICSKLNKKFSMQSLIPINDVNRINTWGTENDIDLITFFYSDFDVRELNLAYKSDVPNTLFLKILSKKYNLTIKYSYYNDIDKYIGYYKIINGNITIDEYSESPKSALYKKLINSCGFNKVSPKKTVRVISLGDIFKQAK